MPLSEKEEDELMGKLACEYMEKELPGANWNNAENLSLVFTYKKTVNLVKLTENLVIHSENLVKHSKHLTWLTIALFVTSVVMIGLVIEQIVLLW